jgi:hypothetical protein
VGQDATGGQQRRTVRIAIEGGSRGYKAANLIGAFRCQQLSHQSVGDTGSRHDSIGRVVTRIVIRADGCGNSPLSVGARSTGKIRCFGQQRHRLGRQAQGRGQPGHAGPYDHDPGIPDSGHSARHPFNHVRHGDGPSAADGDHAFDG